MRHPSRFGPTPGSGEPVLLASNLALGYGDRIVLSSVDMEILPGEVCGFTGPNGSGKSTLLKAALGLIRPIRGSLRVLGAEPHSSGGSFVRRRIGYVPQQRPPGALRITVREAVSMGRYARAGLGRPLGPEDGKAVARALAAAGLEGLEERAVQEISGGQYQRTAIARALAAEPELLVFDEPSTSLDTLGRKETAALIARLAAAAQAGMLLVSHDPELLALCGRIFEFVSGSVREAPP